MDDDKFFKLKGKTLVVIDWANVYGWFKKLNWEIDPKKLYKYLKQYPEVKNINFYFGIEENNKQSENFNKQMNQIGYKTISKNVKWVPVSLDRSHFKKFLEDLHRICDGLEKANSEIAEQLKVAMELPIYRRKCDFDCEIAVDVMNNIDSIDSLILFSGDGDYAVVADELIKRSKQMIVVFAPGYKGKEYGNFKKGLFLCSVNRLKQYLKK